MGGGVGTVRVLPAWGQLMSSAWRLLPAVGADLHFGFALGFAFAESAFFPFGGDAGSSSSEISEDKSDNFILTPLGRSSLKAGI